MLFIEQSLKIALYEWKIVQRSLSFWMLTGLLTVFTWLVLEAPSILERDPVSQTTSVFVNLALLASLLLIFLAVPIWLRDFSPEREIVWGNISSSYIYIFGKLIGTTIVVLFSVLPSLLLLSGTVVWAFGLHALPSLLINGFVILAPTVAVTVSVSILAAVLTRQQIASYLILIALRIIFAVDWDSDFSSWGLYHFALQGIYSSPTIGYGPDSRIVFWNRLTYLALSTAVVAAVFLVFPRLEPRIRSRSHRPTVTFLLTTFIFALVGLAGGVLNLDTAIQTSYAVHPSISSKVEAEADDFELREYKVSMLVDVENSQLTGSATLNIRNGQVPLTALPLLLDTGLAISEVSSDGPADISVEKSKLTFTPSLRSGVETSIEISYSGTPIVNRNVYDRFNRERPSPPGLYLGQSSFFLLRSGSWHPLGEQWALDQLDLTLIYNKRNADKVVHTATEVLDVQNGRRFIWQSLPSEQLLAVSSSYAETNLGNAVVLAPSGYKHLLEKVVSPYVAVAQEMDSHLLSLSPETIRVIVVPLIERSLYDSQTRTLFLNSESFRLYSYFYSEQRDVARDHMFQRWLAEAMARVWWCQESVCYPVPETNYLELQTFNAANATSKTTLSYIALLASRSLLGREFIESEIKNRLQTIEYSEDLIFSDYPRFGIDLDLFVRLSSFEATIGENEFWTMLNEYTSTYQKTEPSVSELEEFICQVTGVALPPIDSEFLNNENSSQ